MFKIATSFFISSLAFSYLLILFENMFSKYGVDKNFDIQKIHLGKSLRMGGIVIFLSFFLNLYIFNISQSLLQIIFLCIIPVFVVGLIEDLTLNVSIKYRFFGSILTSILLVIFGDAFLKDIDIIWINHLLSISLISILITVLGITITANAWNFIDGLNGLSSGLGGLVLLCISYLSYKSSNFLMFEISLYLSATVFGFWIINVMTGKIFLGDSGAYLIGTLIAWSGVVISSGINSVSSWAIFLIIIYPATEAAFSFMRRLFTGKSVVKADDLHLHTLLYNFALHKFPKISALKLNTFCGFFLCLYGLIPMFVSIKLSGSFPEVVYFVVIFIFSYFLIYYMLLRNKKLNKD
jgi:UDP-N-acetylmuramyl pentapeptide phosphotransferase/UDP-N-acetylglucosamine-1-phosphate transferase